jgi:hypothetical protein
MDTALPDKLTKRIGGASGRKRTQRSYRKIKLGQRQRALVGEL